MKNRSPRSFAKNKKTRRRSGAGVKKGSRQNQRKGRERSMQKGMPHGRLQGVNGVLLSVARQQKQGSRIKAMQNDRCRRFLRVGRRVGTSISKERSQRRPEKDDRYWKNQDS